MRKVSSLLQGEICIKYPDPCIVECCKDGARYYSLDRVMDGDSVKDVMTEHDYPITADYVESFHSSTDYKNDLQATLTAPSRGIYADLTAMQRVAKMTPEEIRDFNEYIKSQYVKKSSEANGPALEERKEGDDKK